MKNISANKFWLLFLTLFILLSVSFMGIIYNTQRAKLHDNLKNKLSNKANILTYSIATIIEKNGLKDTKEFLDSVVNIDPSIKTLSIVTAENKKIALSTNEKQHDKIFSDKVIDIKDFQKLTYLEQLIAISIAMESLEHSLLIEIDSEYINQVFDSEMSKILLQIFGVLIIVLIALIFIGNRVFLSPIKQLKKKIESNNLTPEEYLLADLT